MSLLELDGVSKRYREGPTQRAILSGVCLELEAGELVVVRGARRSGRTTLLHVAAGIEVPDTGTVRFDGQAMRDYSASVPIRLCYCDTTLRPTGGLLVYDQLITSQIARGVRRSKAGAAAHHALARVGASQWTARRRDELDVAETVRVTLARALTRDPRLIVIDEPILGVDLLARDELMALLRSFADDGIAILASTGDPKAMEGADRALSMSEGELHGRVTPESATVVTIPVAPPRAAAV